MHKLDRFYSLPGLALLTLVFAASCSSTVERRSLPGAAECTSSDAPLSSQEVEAALEAARACTDRAQCIVVDTYCCARSINASAFDDVADVHACLAADEDCLALCGDSDGLTADCIDGLCSIAPVDPSDSLGGFCGSASYGACRDDADCITSGCSGQICQSASEEVGVTTCEWLDCYDDQAYGVGCGCVNNQCAWSLN